MNYVLMMDPEMIIIGGGLAASGAALLAPLTREIQGGLAWRSVPTISGGRSVRRRAPRGCVTCLAMLNEAAS